MSKPIIYIVFVIVVGGLAAGGAYHYFIGGPAPNPTEPTEQAQSPPPVPVTVTPKPDHGTFQKRFQPTMPPPTGGSK